MKTSYTNETDLKQKEDLQNIPSIATDKANVTGEAEPAAIYTEIFYDIDPEVSFESQNSFEDTVSKILLENLKFVMAKIFLIITKYLELVYSFRNYFIITPQRKF